jgi:hypothetical protein
MITEIAQLYLPSATSEKVDVPLTQYDTDPSAVTWLGAVSASAASWPGPAPAPGEFAAATAVNRGTAASPDWRIVIQINGLTANTYGVWVKASGGVGTSPVRFAGQLVLT